MTVRIKRANEVDQHPQPYHSDQKSIPSQHLAPPTPFHGCKMSTPGPPKISFSFGAKKAAPAGSTPSSSSSSSAFASKSKPKIAPSNPPSAFSLAADDEDDAPPQLVADSSSRSWGKTRVDPKKLVHQAIKPSRVVRERQEEALGLDQKAFAYDEVWDSMKDAERAAKQRKEDESSDRKVRRPPAFVAARLSNAAD